jgi:Domain of unknown function (DUF4410)
VPADAAVAGQYEQTPQTPEQIAAGRQLGAQVAKELAADIRAMGMPAQAVSEGAYPQIGDIVIKGYFVSINEGSAVKRMVIGFGSGGAELTTAVEGYLMTPQGLRKLGSGTVQADPGKTPGAALPRRRRHCERKPDRPHRQQRREGARAAIRQDHDRGQGQANGQGDRRRTEVEIPATGLDSGGGVSGCGGRDRRALSA